jgi:subtilisin
LKPACEYANRKDIRLVKAASNDRSCSDSVTYPAAYDEWILDSTTSWNDALTHCSSTGPAVELAASCNDNY